MSEIGIECNGIFIGAMSFPDRKKPCLVVQRGNVGTVIGTFRNVNAVEEFEIALREMLGGTVNE